MADTTINQLNWSSLTDAQQAQALSRSPLIGDSGLEANVQNIINAVAEQGDSALRAFSSQFDGVELQDIALSATAISEACDRVSIEIKQSIAQAMANIEAFTVPKPFKLSMCKPKAACAVS